MKKFIAYLACAIAFYAGLWLALLGEVEGSRWMEVGAAAVMFAAVVLAVWMWTKQQKENDNFNL